MRSYRVSESAARDLIQTTWTVLDREIEHTATVINLLVDLLDDDEKKKDLLSAWNGFKVEVCSSYLCILWAGITDNMILSNAVSFQTLYPQLSGMASRTLPPAACSTPNRPPQRVRKPRARCGIVSRKLLLRPPLEPASCPAACPRRRNNPSAYPTASPLCIPQRLRLYNRDLRARASTKRRGPRVRDAPLHLGLH